MYFKTYWEVDKKAATKKFMKNLWVYCKRYGIISVLSIGTAFWFSAFYFLRLNFFTWIFFCYQVAGVPNRAPLLHFQDHQTEGEPGDPDERRSVEQLPEGTAVDQDGLRDKRCKFFLLFWSFQALRQMVL